jgi:hypothetical protein
MGSLVVELWPFAAGLAAAPAAIAACILLLGSKRPVANAAAFGAAFVLVDGAIAGGALAAGRSASSPLASGHARHLAALSVGLLAGMVTVAARVSAIARVGAVGLMVLASQLGLTASLAWHLARPSSSATGLAAIRLWLLRNDRLVELTVLVLFGALFTAKGASI